MRIIPILLLLLLPLASSWEMYNLEDFIGYAYNLSGCQGDNITALLADEDAYPPSTLSLDYYVEHNGCENFVRAGYHWFQLTDAGACENFYSFVHEFFHVWNWKFDSCGIVYTKTGLDEHITNYLNGYFDKTLSLNVPQPLIVEHPATDSQENISQLLGGNPSQIDTSWLWVSWRGIPIVLIELVLLILAFLSARTLLWHRHSYKQSDGLFYGEPRRAVVKSFWKKLQEWFGFFIGWNVVFLLFVVFL